MIPSQDLPTGLVTFLFSDIEGSTWLWEQHGQKMRDALARHDEILRLAVHEHNGHIVKTTGDGVHAVFIDALYGLSAAVVAQRKLQGEAWLTIEPDAIRVRIGIHSGTAELRDGDYYGSTLNIAARLMSAGHGGQILVSEATGAIASPQLPDGFSLRDLGRYQLNGIREPQRVLQLNVSDLPSGFPELKARNTAVRNLPGQTTPFIGRRRELAEIQRLLVETDCRLLTLTGPGGMGKTRTAIEAARSIAAENGDLFPDGITFVPLAPVDDLETALRAMADALDYQFGSDEVPQDKQLLTVLSEKGLLLLIDNLEHLLAEGLATFIADILHIASGVKLLVTSRERVNLQAETYLALSGLDGDLPQSINHNTLPKGTVSDATQLFVQSARRSVPDFGLTEENTIAIIQICRLCEGVPLGIELAAGWLGVLMPQEIAAELEKSMDVLSTALRDVPERQRSLRVVFDRSWQLLSDRERETFLCLSVFRGGFQREQGEAAAGTSLPILLTLVNKSFIQREDNRRFGLHEQLRFFANELLRQDKQAWQAAKQAHSHAYAAFVAGQLRKLRGREQMAALGEIERELDNIRVAWEWLVTQEDMNVLVAQMLPVLYRFYTLRARQADMEPLLFSALAKVKSAAGGKATINFLILQTVVIDLYFQQLIRMPFLYPGGRSLLEKLWPIAVAHRRDMGEWFDRFMLHHILNVGEEEAYRQWEDHIVDLRNQGDDWTLAYSLQWFAFALRVTDRNRTRPFDYLEEALPLFIKIGDKFEIAQTFFGLGWMSEWKGDYLHAVENYQQAQQLLVEQGGDARRGRIIHVMVGLYMKIGQPRKGFSLLAEEQALYRGLNRLDLLKHSLHWESIMASRHSDLEHAFRTRNESMAVGQVIARALDRDEAETLNWDYFELGELYRVAGDLVQASRYYEMAGKIFTLNDDAKGHAFYRRALGDLALTERQFDRAEAHYRFYLTHARDTKSFFEIAVATIGLGRALRGLGRYQESEECLREALVLVDNPAIVDFIMWPILALAELKASKEEYISGAILAAYVLQHPLAWLEMRSLAEGVLHEIQPQIDPNFDVQTAAQEATRTLIPDFDLAYLPPLG